MEAWNRLIPGRCRASSDPCLPGGDRWGIAIMSTCETQLANWGKGVSNSNSKDFLHSLSQLMVIHRVAYPKCPAELANRKAVSQYWFVIICNSLIGHSGYLHVGICRRNHQSFWGLNQWRLKTVQSVSDKFWQSEYVPRRRIERRLHSNLNGQPHAQIILRYTVLAGGVETPHVFIKALATWYPSFFPLSWILLQVRPQLDGSTTFHTYPESPYSNATIWLTKSDPRVPPPLPKMAWHSGLS